MQDIAFVEIKQKHLDVANDWTRDATNILLKLTSTSSDLLPNSIGYAAIDSNESLLAIALINTDNDNVSYLECIVNPAYRRRGLGAQIIEYLLNQPEVKKLAHINTLVAPANLAAQRTLIKLGFSKKGYSTEGEIEYSRLSKAE